MDSTDIDRPSVSVGPPAIQADAATQSSNATDRDSPTEVPAKPRYSAQDGYPPVTRPSPPVTRPSTMLSNGAVPLKSKPHPLLHNGSQPIALKNGMLSTPATKSDTPSVLVSILSQTHSDTKATTQSGTGPHIPIITPMSSLSAVMTTPTTSSKPLPPTLSTMATIKPSVVNPSLPTPSSIPITSISMPPPTTTPISSTHPAHSATGSKTAAEQSTNGSLKEPFRESVSPSVLHANEELISEDESDNMETNDVSQRDVLESSESLTGSPYRATSESDMLTSGTSMSLGTTLGSSSRETSEGVSPLKQSYVPSCLTSFSTDKATIPDGATTPPYNMTSHNFPKRTRTMHRAALYAMHPYHRATCRAGTGVTLAKSLDLMKAVLQTSFNHEVKQLCDDYFQIYTNASNNIRDNTGETIPESTLKTLISKMLEEAIQGYQNEKWSFPSDQLPKSDKVSDSRCSPMSSKKQRVDKDISKYTITNNKRGRKPTEKASENAKSAWKWSLDKRRLDPGTWSVDNITEDTLFVLGVNVNKALGHSANRGKVYLLHPQLFKYVCDGDDKTWLYDNKYLPVHGGKAFLMIFNEVEMLVKNEDSYRDNSEILKSVLKLQRFAVPPFMLTKMKDFIKNVQVYFAQETLSTDASAIKH